MIKEISDEERLSWDALVCGHPGASPFHLYGWGMAIRNAYHLSSMYLGAFEDSLLLAVLPTFIMRQPLRKPYAISLPFCNYAGWLIRDDCEEKLVKGEVLKFLASRGISFVEIRQVGQSRTNDVSELTMRLSLPSSSEILWKDLDPKVRNLVRKAQKLGLSVRWGNDQLDEFYEIYARNMALLGTPVHAKRLFEELSRHVSDHIALVTVRKNEQAIAAMFLLKFRRQLSDVWASSLREFDAFSPSMLLYWGALKFGSDMGFREFDFGRSSIESGTYRFKLQWGAEPVPLEHEIVSLDGRQRNSSVSAYRGSSAKMFSALWKSLPYPLTRRLGPMLRKYLP